MVFLEHGVASKESKFNKLFTILTPIDFGNVRDIQFKRNTRKIVHHSFV
jgi:hypothetical protein